MPKIPPASSDAHPGHAESAADSPTGWCSPCYQAGSFTLAADPAGLHCLVHGAPACLPSSGPPSSGPPSGGRSGGGGSGGGRPGGADPSGPGTTEHGSRPPRGRAARRPAPPDRPQASARASPRADRRRARARIYGRHRAAVRVAGPGYAPHPGWRHLIATGWRVLVDQAEALAVVEALVDAQDWRADKRTAWSAILRQLVCGMDWDTGLVAALTAHRLGAAGGRAPRTVSRVIAWAREVGLIVVVEHGASAEFLGTEHGRTPTYALVTDIPQSTPATDPPPAVPGVDAFAAERFAAERLGAEGLGAEGLGAEGLGMPVEETGDPPKSLVENKPSNGDRLEPATPIEGTWPVFGIPRSAPERTAAAQCLLRRLGLDRGGVSRVPLWRARALLRQWWDAGACPAALLWAIDHHPDRPEHHRGDALRGALDPLRVLGARLRPWRDRLTELPASLTGVPGDYRQAPTGAPAPVPAPVQARVARSTAESPVPPRPTRPGGSAAARAAARAAVEEHLAELRRRRTTRDGSPPTGP